MPMMTDNQEREMQLARIDLRRSMLENVLTTLPLVSLQPYDPRREEIELELRNLWAVRRRLTAGARG